MNRAKLLPCPPGWWFAGQRKRRGVWSRKGDDAVRVTFINVGYGDAVLFQTSSGQNLLLDGGSDLQSEFEGDAYRLRAVDFLKTCGIKQLDAVVISHIHEDHVCGLVPILRTLPVKQFFVPYPIEPFLEGRVLRPDPGAARSVPLYTAALNAYRDILRDAREAGVPVHVLTAGDICQPVSGMSMHVLGPRPTALAAYMDRIQQVYDPTASPETVTRLLTELDASSNGTSFLLRIEAEKQIFLMAADSCPREWNEVPSSSLESVTVLKLPHHGQIDSVDEHLMKNMCPGYVVTTASSDRRYNSANVKAYERMRALWPEGGGPCFLFTDEREYLPYFHQPEGFQAIRFEISSGEVRPEFIKIT